MSCVFCQNYKISQQGKGHEITIDELANIFLDLQQKKANNINLVTPTMYVPQIIEAVSIAKENGLILPIIYNTNGYENIETIKALNGYIDVYLPDFKYFDNNLAKKYSKVNNYFEIASKAIQEMYFQVGLPKFNKDGIIQKGLIIRHLVLPNNLENSKNVLLWIKQNMPKETYISLMTQYFPTHKADSFVELNRQLTIEEYNNIRAFFSKLGFINGYFQELGENEGQYVPDF